MAIVYNLFWNSLLLLNTIISPEEYSSPRAHMCIVAIMLTKLSSPHQKKTKLTFPQEKRQLLISEKDGALHTVFTDRMICTVYSGFVHLHSLLSSLKSPLNHHPGPHHVHLQKKQWSQLSTESKGQNSGLTGLLARAAVKPATREAIRCNAGPCAKLSSHDFLDLLDILGCTWILWTIWEIRCNFGL